MEDDVEKRSGEERLEDGEALAARRFVEGHASEGKSKHRGRCDQHQGADRDPYAEGARDQPPDGDAYRQSMKQNGEGQ